MALDPGTPGVSPVLDRLFSVYLGDLQGVGHRLLSEAYSPAGSRNVWIDKIGRLTAGGDFREMTAIGMPGTANQRIGGLYFFANVDPVPQMLLIGVFYDFPATLCDLRWATLIASFSTAGPWAGLAALGGANVATVPDFAQLGDELFFTNGSTGGPRIIRFGAVGPPPTTAIAGATQLAAPTTALFGVGILNGVYQWRIVPIKNDNTRKPGSVASAADFQVVNQQVTLGWIADPDVTVSGYEIYRTTGSGKSYWRVAYVDGRLTVAYVDNIDDKTILQDAALEAHGDAPPVGQFYVEMHKARGWWGRTNVFPRRLYYSDPGDPDSVNLTSGYMDFTDAENTTDYLTGMTGNYKDMLVAWLHDTVWTVSGSGQIFQQVIDWTKRKTNARTGCLIHRTVVKVPKGARYTDELGAPHQTQEAMLAYMTPLGDIRLFDGDSDYIISYPKKDLLLPEALTNLRQGEGTNWQPAQFGFHDEPHGLAIWYIYGGNAVISTAVVWNYRLGTWHEFSGQTFGHVISARTRVDPPTPVAGESNTATGSKTYLLYEGLGGQNGATLPTRFITAPLRFGLTPDAEPDDVHMKRFRWTDWRFKKMSAPLTLTVEAIAGDTDDADVLSAPAIMSFTLSTTGHVLKKKLETTGGRYVTDYGIRLRCTQSSVTGIWTLDYLRIAYQVLKGLMRT